MDLRDRLIADVDPVLSVGARLYRKGLGVRRDHPVGEARGRGVVGRRDVAESLAGCSAPHPADRRRDMDARRGVRPVPTLVDSDLHLVMCGVSCAVTGARYWAAM